MPSRRRRRWLRSRAQLIEAQFSGTGKSARDPVRLSEAVVAVAGQKGWSGAIVEGAIFDQWHLLVGAEVAAHVRPEAYLGGSRELVVVADSPAWATQIKLLQRPLLARINEHFGSKKVLKLVVKSQIGGQRRVFRRRVRHPQK